MRLCLYGVLVAFHQILGVQLNDALVDYCHVVGPAGRVVGVAHQVDTGQRRTVEGVCLSGSGAVAEDIRQLLITEVIGVHAHNDVLVVDDGLSRLRVNYLLAFRRQGMHGHRVLVPVYGHPLVLVVSSNNTHLFIARHGAYCGSLGGGSYATWCYVTFSAISIVLWTRQAEGGTPQVQVTISPEEQFAALVEVAYVRVPLSHDDFAGFCCSLVLGNDAHLCHRLAGTCL